MPHARSTLPTAIADDERTDLITDSSNRLIVAPQMRQESPSGVADGVALGAGGETTLISAPGSGNNLCLSSFHIRVSGVTTIKLLAGSAGTVIWAVALGATEFMPVAFPTALCFGDNKAIVLLSSAAVTVYATAQAVKVK